MPNQPPPNRTHAALIAASSVVVSKFAKRRLPEFTRIPPGFELPTLEDVRRLLEPRDDESAEEKVARVTACSILQSLEATGADDDEPYQLKGAGVAKHLVSQNDYARLELHATRARPQLEDALKKYSPREVPKAKKLKGTQSKRAQAQRKAALTAAITKAFEPQLNVCRYCGLFQELLHEHPAPIEVLNHSARINSDFNPDTNISEAGIVDFQLFVPEKLARKAIEQSHPLSWENTAKAMFEKSRPATTGETKRPDLEWQMTTDTDWSAKAFSGHTTTGKQSIPANQEPVGYLYEIAKHPWNEQITAIISNVFRITDFASITVPASTFVKKGASTPTLREHVRGLAKNQRKQARKQRGLKKIGMRKGTPPTGAASGTEEVIPPKLPSEPQPPSTPIPRPPLSPKDALILSYGYELESCVSSNFGLGLQNGGLDVDDGRFDGSALHYTQITRELVAHLKRSDLIHLVLGLLRRHDKGDLKARDLDENLLVDLLLTTQRLSRQAEADAKLEVVQRIAEVLKTIWGVEPWLLTISASKRLRYTYPRDGQTELWALLTWMAPAFLFNFINRSVCQLPHFLQLDPSTCCSIHSNVAPTAE